MIMGRNLGKNLEYFLETIDELKQVFMKYNIGSFVFSGKVSVSSF